MRTHFFKFYILMSILVFFSTSAMAQSENVRFSRVMTPIDSVTLKNEGIEVRLWGVQPASSSETQIELRAIQHMEELIKNTKIHCKVIRTENSPSLTARCNTIEGEDIALSLLSKGLVIRDRRVLFDTVFASSYATAENSAAEHSLGIWKYTKGDQKSILNTGLTQKGIYSYLFALLFFTSLIGTLVFGILYKNTRRKLQSYEKNVSYEFQRKEAALHKQERHMLLSQIKTELEENKGRAEAFLSIYTKMLSNIKDPETSASYQSSGDIVSLQPEFLSHIFQEHKDRISKIDSKMSSRLRQTYDDLEHEQDYIDLTPETPISDAILILEKVLSDAKLYLPRIDEAIMLIETQLSHYGAT